MSLSHQQKGGCSLYTSFTRDTVTPPALRSIGPLMLTGLTHVPAQPPAEPGGPALAVCPRSAVSPEVACASRHVAGRTATRPLVSPPPPPQRVGVHTPIPLLPCYPRSGARQKPGAPLRRGTTPR